MPETTPEPVFDPVQSRRDEVAAYQANIGMYQSILTQLPVEWPERLVQFQGRTDHQKAITELPSAADVELLADLLFREQCENAIRTETLEQRKAAAILAALEAQQA
jgi:hypothetical protein